jgi:hypothetical protein
VNLKDPEGLEADCLSLDLNAAGFGLRGELGGGVCWDDEGKIRGMTHIDGGAGSGWGAGISGTWQTTNAKSVDDQAGQSMAVGGSTSSPKTPFYGASVTTGADKAYADEYEGEAYSIGLGWVSPLPAENHDMLQNTILWGGKSQKQETPWRPTRHQLLLAILVTA